MTNANDSLYDELENRPFRREIEREQGLDKMSYDELVEDN